LLEKNGCLADIVEETVAQNDVHDGIADTGRQRISAECRTMRSGGHALAGAGCRKTRTDREAATQRFRNRHDIRLDAAALIAEQLASASDAGLHFVEHKKKSLLVAKLTKGLHELRRHDPHAAFTLHGLD